MGTRTAAAVRVEGAGEDRGNTVRVLGIDLMDPFLCLARALAPRERAGLAELHVSAFDGVHSTRRQRIYKCAC